MTTKPDAANLMTEDWLLANLPEGWAYDCQFVPVPAFTITATDGRTLTIPLALLNSPEPRAFAAPVMRPEAEPSPNPVLLEQQVLDGRWAIRRYANGMHDAAQVGGPGLSPGLDTFNQALGWACEQEAARRLLDEAAKAEGCTCPEYAPHPSYCTECPLHGLDATLACEAEATWEQQAEQAWLREAEYDPAWMTRGSGDAAHPLRLRSPGVRPRAGRLLPSLHGPRDVHPGGTRRRAHQ